MLIVHYKVLVASTVASLPSEKGCHQGKAQKTLADVVANKLGGTKYQLAVGVEWGGKWTGPQGMREVKVGGNWAHQKLTCLVLPQRLLRLTPVKFLA